MITQFDSNTGKRIDYIIPKLSQSEINDHIDKALEERNIYKSSMGYIYLALVLQNIVHNSFVSNDEVDFDRAYEELKLTIPGHERTLDTIYYSLMNKK